MTGTEYEIVRSKRKTIGIHVYRDGRVVVRAPQRTPLAEIKRLVSLKEDWIVRKRAELAAQPAAPLPPRYVDGEQHLFLGQSYPLRVVVAKRPGVELTGGKLLLRLPDGNDTAHKEKLLDSWYRQQARAIFEERLALVHPTAAPFGIPYPPVHVRLMKTRWGSCSSRGNINLNLRLIQTPLSCIDYVIMHELAHFKVPNHSAAYYKLLDALMPDWRARRQRLQRVPVL